MNVKDEKQGRIQLVEYGNKLLELGLVQGTWGNLSVRLDSEYMITTPSGLDYSRVTPEDMVKVNINTLEYGDGHKPTSEKGLHGGIYKLHPEAGAVIHTHSKYCSIFAAAGMPLQVEDTNLQEILGEVINIAEYGLPGTKKLTANTIKALGNKHGCIMTSHGMICWGADIEEALDMCCSLERAAEIYVDKRYSKK